MDSQHEGEDSCKHDTAIDEAIHRFELTIHQLQDELQLCGFFSFRKRTYLTGMMIAFAMAVRLLDDLSRKYDNSRGTLN